MSQTINDLLTLMARLRDPQSGCSWDIKQTFATIAPYTLEEACEVVDAIEREDYDHLREELGDLLLQVIFHAQIGSEAGYFNFDDVANTLLEKMIRRHPHVFPEGTLTSSMASTRLTPEQVKAKWEAIKKEEKRQKQQNQSGSSSDSISDSAISHSAISHSAISHSAISHSAISHSAISHSAMPDDLPVVMPALKRAHKLQSAAAKVGFDWPQAQPVFDKIAEEIDEIKEAMVEQPEKLPEEVGDLLFACVNLARHLGVDADMAMRQANGKFDRRFRTMEVLASKNSQEFQQLTLEEMENYWQQSKAYDPAG